MAAGEPSWKAYLAAAKDVISRDQRLDLAKPFADSLHATLQRLHDASPTSNKLRDALDLNSLITAVNNLGPDDVHAFRQLRAVNDAVAACGNPRLGLVLVEQGFLTALVRLHSRVGNMAHPLSRAVVLVLLTTALLADAAVGHMEAVAAFPDALQLAVSHLVFLCLDPRALRTPAGLGTAQRCVQLCWEVTRHKGPKCSAFRELLVSADMSRRLLQLGAVALAGSIDAGEEGAADGAEGGAGGGGGGGGGAAAALESMAALEERAAGGGDSGGGGRASASAAPAASAGAAAAEPDADACFEERVALAAQALSLSPNLAGLGVRGIELSAAGLAPQRAWLLRPGTLTAMRGALDALVDGLAGLRRRMEVGAVDRAEPAGQDEGAGAEGGDADPDLRAAVLPRPRLLGQAEGAVRNLLMLLGLPTVVMGTGEHDVVEACGFVIRHMYGMFTEGYVDTMRALRAAVSDPVPPLGAGHSPASAGPYGTFTEPYPGDYAQFFKAFAGHIETVAPALGVQLEDWGVRFTGEQARDDLPTMNVQEGVDARIAQSWLKGQIQNIVNWGHAMLGLVRLADQAKLPKDQRAGPGPQPGFPSPPAPRPFHPPPGDGSSGHVPPVDAPCASCGTAPPAEGPPFMLCGRCKGVRFCSRACQVSVWPTHKLSCKPAAGAPAALQAPAAGGGTGDGASAQGGDEAAE